MNASQLVAKALEFLDDPNGVRFPTSLVLEYVNEGQKDFTRSTSLLQRLSMPLGPGPSQPNGSFYLLPDDFLELSSGGVWCNYGGANQQLRPINPNEMGSNWDGIKASRPYAYVRLLAFGMTELRVWPNPFLPLTGLTIYYNYLPNDLILTPNPTTSPLPTQYHQALVYYAVSQCYMGDGQYKDPSKAAFFLDKYKREIQDAERAAERRFSSGPVVIRRPHL